MRAPAAATPLAFPTSSCSFLRRGGLACECCRCAWTDERSPPGLIPAVGAASGGAGRRLAGERCQGAERTVDSLSDRRPDPAGPERGDDDVLSAVRPGRRRARRRCYLDRLRRL